MKDFDRVAPEPPTTGPPETCKGNPNALNSSLCSGMEWACGPDQTYADIQVRTHIYGRRQQIKFMPHKLCQTHPSIKDYNLNFRLNVIKEKHGAVVGMVVVNVESKIFSMMLTSFTMRTTKRLVYWYKIVILMDLQLSPQLINKTCKLRRVLFQGSDVHSS